MATSTSTASNLPVHNYDPSYWSGAKVRSSEWNYHYAAVTASTTLVANTTGNHATCHSLVEVTSGSPTLTLPTAVGIQGMYFVIKNTGSGTVILATTSSQTIDGAATQSITQYQSLTVVSNNANWVLI
jgi:hypothetical protein